MIMVASLPELHNYNDDEDGKGGDEDGDEDDDDDNLVVAPLPKNFMSPPSIISQKHRGM